MKIYINNLKKTFGPKVAVDIEEFQVNDGEILGLVGNNGAGKSTTLKAIMSLVSKPEGHIEFDGVDITKMETRNVVKQGVVLCPEGRRVFPDLTVEENLIMGSYLRKDKDGIKKDKEWVYELFPRMKEREWQMAGTLSGGEQQMLAMGRALMSHPKLLMMDEPSMGLSPLLVDQVFEIIKDINKDGTTILLVEQNAGKSLAISDRAYVLETGKIVLSGTGKELMESEDVKKAYLGG